MRVVVVVDPDKLETRLTNIATRKEKRIGEIMEIRNQSSNKHICYAEVVAIRDDIKWPGGWLYDVVILDEINPEHKEVLAGFEEGTGPSLRGS